MTTLVLEHLQHADSASPDITIDSSGRVGIGEVNPAEKLEVSGNIKLDTGSTQYIDFKSGTSGAKNYRIYNGVGWNSDALLVYNHSDDSTILTIEPGKLGINRGANSLTQALEVGGSAWISGNVGIGTQSPASTLDVKGDFRITRNVAAGHASEGNWNFNISMENAAYYGSLYLLPSVSTGELSVMGDKLRVTQSSGVHIISDTGNSTSSDNVSIRYNGTAGGHKSGYLFKDKRDVVNAAVKNNLINDGVNTAAAELQLYTSTGGTLARGMNISQYGKVEFDKMPNFATRPYYTNTELGSGAVVDFYDAHVNTGNHFNGANGRFTAPYAGDYYFAFHSNIWKNAAGVLYFDWYKNGSSIVNTYGGRIYGYYSGGWENMMGFVVLPLAVNDYVDLRAAGGSPKVDGGSYGQFIGYALTTP